MKDSKQRRIRAAFSSLLTLVIAATLMGALPTPALAVPADEQIFQLEIKVFDDGSAFMLPINSQQGPTHPLYDWAIDWGDGSRQIASGTGGTNVGIFHVYSLAGEYTVSIRPHGSTEAWLAAFGFGPRIIIMYASDSLEAAASPQSMVLGVPTPITPEMTRTQAQIDGSVAPPYYEWAYAFMDCYNLTLVPSFVGWEGITAVGNGFARSMYTDCSSLAALPAGFNLPQSIEVSGGNFADYMFYGAGSPSFQINDDFCLPRGVYSQTYSNFNQTFRLSNNAPLQNRTAASIIGNCPTPSTQSSTFDSHFSDLPYIPVNWGGGGLPKVGAPGSGDLDGDGFVTMSEVSICALAAIGSADLSPAQLDAIDIDRDGVITMADVMSIYKLAIM